MKKNTQKSDKRQKILIAARTLFNRTHNIKRVSLEAIAEEAGVSPTTIYNNFGDRETLVYEVIKDLVKTNLERNRAFIHSELPFAQKLIGVISAKLDVAEKFNTEIIEKLVSQDKKITPFIDKILQEEIKPLWCEMVADGKKRGYIDTALDDEALLAYLDVLQAGFRARPEVLQGFQNNLEQLTHLMFYGFLKKEIDLFQKEDK
jgi:AcrR family transcriptional regulator